MDHHLSWTNIFRMMAIALVSLIAFAVTVSGLAQPADAKQKVKVSLKIKTKDQAALLKAHKLTVKVKASAKVKLKLSAANAGKSSRFQTRTIKFGRKGTRTVKLKLTHAGRSVLRSCGAKTVTARATWGKVKVKKKAEVEAAKKDDKKVKSKSRVAKAKKKLAKSPKRCHDSPDGPEAEKSLCDPLDQAVCLQPWPNNYYTKPANTKTGLQLDLPVEAMPMSRNNKRIDPTEINRSDGFSPGSMIITKIPELESHEDFVRDKIVSISDMASYADPDQAVVLLDAETGKRQPIWAELDSTPTTKPAQELVSGQAPIDIAGGHPDDSPNSTMSVNLIIRPAKNLTPGRRYVVAIRNLTVDESGVTIPLDSWKDVRTTPFKICRDGSSGPIPPRIRYRCSTLDQTVFPVLEKGGISRENLYLAWDFTVASQENTTGRAVAIRDDAFKRLPDGGDSNLADREIQGGSPQWGGPGNSPDLAVTESTDPGSPWLRSIDGELKNVPCYLNKDGCPTGSSFSYTDDGKLTWNPEFTTDVPFRCRIPRSVTTTNPGSITPAMTGIFGHGLLGDYSQVFIQDGLGNRSNSIWCAVNWAGFSKEDMPTVANSLSDLSNFSQLADRMQQGFVNFMFLQRALIHPAGLATDPAFSIDPDGAGGAPAASTIDTSGGTGQRGYYMGISQGGIMGGALTALSPDTDDAVLAVPGINYSTLLSRSVDFDLYAHGVVDLGTGPKYFPGVGLYDNYPNLIERPLGFSLMQLLWDRGEGNGYVQTLNPAARPLPNTPPHTALLQLAIGDHQVANVAAEVEARTIGAKVYTPSLLPGRHWSSDPLFGLTDGGSSIPEGNTMVYYDGGPAAYDCTAPNTPIGCRGQGSDLPPDQNVPPRPQWGYGGDPHNYPWTSEDGLTHAETFLKGNDVNACQAATQYCFSNGWDGVTGLP